MTPIHIDLRTALPMMRAAVNAGQLQSQQPYESSRRCRYSGPCIIGSAIPLDRRADLDNFSDTGFSSLRREGFITCPKGQSKDLANLQELHDRVVHTNDPLTQRNQSVPPNDRLEALLGELEGKYL